MANRDFFVDIDLNQNEIQFGVFHNLGAAPSVATEVAGQFYYDTGSNTPFFYNGSSWISMSSAAASNVAFSGVTTSTNTTETLTVGSGGSLTFSGLGIVNANQIDGYAIDMSDPPADGEILQYVGGSVDAWIPVASGSHVHAGEDITSGTINDDRLSSNVGLLDAPQLWSAANQFDDLSITGIGGRHTFASQRTAGGIVTLNDVDGDIPIISTITDNNGDVLVRDGEGFEERPLVESDITDLGTYFDTAGVGLSSSGSTINIGAGNGLAVGLTDMSLDINSLVVATIADGDFVPFWDITAIATNKKTTFANFQAEITTVGTITTGVWNGTDIAIADGGTGASTQQAALDNLSGLTTRGDLLVQDASGNAVRLAVGSVGQFILSDGSDPSWATISTTTIPEGVNLYFTDERVDDRVSALIQDGTGLTWTYVDGSNTLTGNVSLSSFDTGDLTEGSNLYYTDERVDDRVDSLLTQGTNITLTYDDGAGTLTIDASGGIDGSGATNRVATWSDSDTLTSDADFTFDGTDIKLANGDIVLSSITSSFVSGKDRAGASDALFNLVNDGNTQKFILLEHYYNSSAVSNDIRFIRSRGTEASKIPLSSGDELGTISFYGHTTAGATAEGAFVVAESNEAWSAGGAGTSLKFGVAPTGTPASASTRMTLSSTDLVTNVPLRTGPGTAAAPTYSFSTDSDNGMYLAATSIVGISANGSQIASFDGSGGTPLSTVTGNFTVTGDLLIEGTTTTINTENLIVEDNFIVVNSTGVDVDAGIEVERGVTANAFIYFNETANEWFVDNSDIALRVARKFIDTTSIAGNGALLTFDIDHSMGTSDVVVAIYNPSDVQVEAEIVITDSNTVTVNFSKPPSVTYKAIIIG